MENMSNIPENTLFDLIYENVVKTESDNPNVYENSEKLLETNAKEPKEKECDMFDDCVTTAQKNPDEENFTSPDNEIDKVHSHSQNEIKTEAVVYNQNIAPQEIESDYLNPYASVRQDKQNITENKQPLITETSPFDGQTMKETSELNTTKDNPMDSHTIRSECYDKKSFQIGNIFNECGLETWLDPAKLHPKVESLIYWRDVKKSGMIFGAGLTLLIAMSLFSLISVFSYVSLLILFGTVCFRIYRNVLQAVQKTAEGHPFKEYLDVDLALSQEKVQELAVTAVAHVNALLTELRRLFLVEDLVDSIKFGVVLYCLTYLGAMFNGMTCVIIAFVALFTLPKVYENNKQSIDSHLELVRSKVQEITEKVKATVPIGKKVESEKNK